MTFLELVRRLALESAAELQERIDDVTVTPATSYGSTTEHINRFITWIKQAWLEIQNDQSPPSYWRFMVERGSLALSVGQTTYDIAANHTDPEYDGIIPFVAPLDRRYIWCVDTNKDPNQKQPCYYVPPEHFFGDRDRYTNDQGRPYAYTFGPDGDIVVEPAPSIAGYELQYDFRRMPQELSANTDTPLGLPDKFHMIIVYWALMEHGLLDESERQFVRAQRNYKRMMQRLRMEQLPEYTMPGTR